MVFSKEKADLLKQTATFIKATGRMEHLMDKVSILTRKLNKFTRAYGKMASIKENAKVLKQNLLLILSTKNRELLFLSILWSNDKPCKVLLIIFQMRNLLVNPSEKSTIFFWVREWIVIILYSQAVFVLMKLIIMSIVLTVNWKTSGENASIWEA